MNTKRRRSLIRLIKKLEEIKEKMSQISQEEQLALDNLPTNLSIHGKADAMKSALDSLDDADYSLDEVITYLNDAVNEEVEYREIGEPLFEKVAEYIVTNNDASITHIKRDFHIGQERVKNIISRLISADVLNGIIICGTPKDVTIKVHDLEMLKEKLDIYDCCRKLKEHFNERHPNIDVFGPHLGKAIQITVGGYSLAILLLDNKRKWWICEVTKEARGMGSVDDYVIPLELEPEILDEFKGIFDSFEETVMRKEFFASYDDPIDCFVKAYDKLTQLEKEGKLG